MSDAQKPFQAESPELWWQGAVFYQVYPRSFSDSNGDGEGDLVGITKRLDYLVSLNVDALWLSPFYRSPLADGGYDVANPRDVDPRFGTLADFKQLLDMAHSKGLRVVVDIVPNHFSQEHHWFQAALASAPGSHERARFHFREGRGQDGSQPPNNWQSVFGGSAWTRIKEQGGKPGQWYLHVFDSSQPDLNWEHPDVAADFDETLRFWLDMGVDGFRIDVAHGMCKDPSFADHPDPDALMASMKLEAADEGDESVVRDLIQTAPYFDRDEVHHIYRRWRHILNEYDHDPVTVAEAWVHPPSRAALYARTDELSQVFNFEFLVATWDAEVIKSAISVPLSSLAEVGAPATWVLSNHDVKRVATRLGEKRARAMALIAQALPGSLYVFQGEELGLPDAEIPGEARQDPVWFRTGGAEPGRDGCRVPLPWLEQGKTFGFSSADSEFSGAASKGPWLPQPIDWGVHSVAAQETDEHSFLWLYRKGLAIRRVNPALGWHGGDFEFLSDVPDELVAFRREPNFVCIANIGSALASVCLNNPTVLLASAEGVSVRGQDVMVPPDTTAWFTTES
jgi:alpha-glucosidase